MARIDTRGSATMHLTDDEHAAVLERVQATRPDSELARVLADAAPTDQPETVPVVEVREVEGVGGEMVQANVQVGELLHTYAITVPPNDHDLAADALRSELSNPEAAELVANNDPEVL